MSHLLHADRLRLRSCQIADFDSLHELRAEADVRRFLLDDRQFSREEGAIVHRQRAVAPLLRDARSRQG